ATELIHRKRPGCLVGAYTGSWYDSSFQVGVNWAADDYAAGLDWMSPAYSQTGYAGLLDWITTGCYFPVARREDARAAGAPERFTVEAAAEYATRVVNDATFHYAGINLADYRGRPEAFRNAVQAARKNSQGVMLFDLVYVEEYGWWDLIKELFATPQRAPHDIPGLRDALRQAHRSLAEANR
ncbi:MAG: hypothetical protein HY320_11865, partial [Armatimonadetes bacterium]|nr:hypothetical protein [Armatimonadota bacterium]